MRELIKNRFILYLVAILLLLLSARLISSLLAYFELPQLQDNVALSNINKFHDEEYSEVGWVNERFLEKSVSTFIKSELENAYVKGLRLLHSKENFTGLRKHEHLAPHLLERLESTNDSTGAVSFEREFFSHKMDITFISEDYSIISFIDHEAVYLQSIVVKDEFINVLDTASFQVLMRLTDGSWQIENLRKLPFKDFNKEEKKPRELKFLKGKAKGVNYYPQKVPWKLFWDQYPADTVEIDIAKIRSLGFDHIRVFVPFIEIGGPKPTDSFFKKFDHLLAICDQEEIDLVVTLFDFPNGFEIIQLTEHLSYLRAIVGRYQSHPRIVLWDLKNEPDIDFIYHGKQKVMRWLSIMLESIKILDKDTQITIGWARIENAALLANRLDVISFHHYTGLDELNIKMNTLRTKLGNSEKKIWITEYGKSSKSYLLPWVKLDKKRKKYLKELESYFLEEELNHTIWCLYDYDAAPIEVFGWKPWVRRVQKEFGVLTKEGQEKK